MFENIMVLDFETAWDKREYTLSKLTTEQYIRDPRFKVWGAAWKWLGAEIEPQWLEADSLPGFFQAIDWSKTAVVAHNAQFDVAILSWHYGHLPAFIFDSLSMARALRGIEVGNSLKKLAEIYGLPPKGDAVHSSDGYLDALPQHILDELGAYCQHDVRLCEAVFTALLAGYPKKELRLIDMTLRMFVNPTLKLDSVLLQKAIEEERTRREGLLSRLHVPETALASNDQFAEVLRLMGIEPPTKISKTTGEKAFAFAKNDALFQALLNGDNEDVALLCEARLAVKSTLERTRAQRFLDISQRGTLPVPLNYYGAHTGRWAASRGSGINMQNLKRGSFLRKAIMAPAGYQLVVCDLSQIEPRVLAWLADYSDLLSIFKSGQDAYAAFGAQMFGIPGLSKETHPDLRQSAKSALLGAGYGLGWASFAAQLLTGFLGAPPIRYDIKFAKQLGVNKQYLDDFVGYEPNVERALSTPRLCTDDEIIVHCVAAKKIIDIYRERAAAVRDFWSMCDDLLVRSLVNGKAYQHKCLTFEKGRIGLPNALHLRYPDLTGAPDEKGRMQWVYGETKKKVYGGKITENCIAGGTEVLTARGWVPIEDVEPTDLVHDGVEFVTHGGVVFKALQSCVSIDGVYMTPDHEVLTDEGWKAASQNPKPYRPTIRGACSDKPRTQQRQETLLALSVRLWEAVREGWGRRNKGNKTWRDSQLRVPDTHIDVQSKHNSRYVKTSGVRGMALYARPLSLANTPCVEKLWRQGHTCVQALAEVVSKLLGRYGQHVLSWVGLGSCGQRWPVLAGELSLGVTSYERNESTDYRTAGRRNSIKPSYWYSAHHAVLQARARMAGRSVNASAVSEKPVYDIVNCGPRQRFVVRGSAAPFIVHNCVQAVARCVMTDGMLRIQKRYPCVLTVHDEVVCLVPEDEAKEAEAWVLHQMVQEPSYMPGIPLNAETGVAQRYGDAK